MLFHRKSADKLLPRRNSYWAYVPMGFQSLFRSDSPQYDHSSSRGVARRKKTSVGSSNNWQRQCRKRGTGWAVWAKYWKMWLAWRRRIFQHPWMKQSTSVLSTRHTFAIQGPDLATPYKVALDKTAQSGRLQQEVVLLFWECQRSLASYWKL